jgi:hypothetical protein
MPSLLSVFCWGSVADVVTVLSPFIVLESFQNAREPAPQHPAATPLLILADDASALDVLPKPLVTASSLFDPSEVNGRSA